MERDQQTKLDEPPNYRLLTLYMHSKALCKKEAKTNMGKLKMNM
jgi:hypothetical protein